ncbi:hypothetical protein SAMN05421663_101231 [Terribacillus halophilus]|uniref:Uncharacterized protein n=1 Tax=Terribacillus halophilus TaxID=361279 RepID=A0A1G6ICI0_9BACI|nr:hypothetical protein SAMN05421663_101231 [Terribacillus halophilus]
MFQLNENPNYDVNLETKDMRRFGFFDVNLLQRKCSAEALLREYCSFLSMGF